MREPPTGYRRLPDGSLVQVDQVVALNEQAMPPNMGSTVQTEIALRGRSSIYVLVPRDAVEEALWGGNA